MSTTHYLKHFTTKKRRDKTPFRHDYLKNQKNTGSGAAYLGKSLAAGVGTVFEGLGDLIGAAAAELRGDHAYAEYLFANNEIGKWKEEFTEEYNPNGLMSVLGDVAGGLGQSAVYAAASLVPVPGFSIALIGASATGSGISDAVAKTGELGGREVIRGVLSGVTEATVEAFFGSTLRVGASLTTGKLAPGLVGNTISKLGGVSTLIAKSRLGNFAYHFVSSGAEEALEEFASGLAQPLWDRITGVDKEARLNGGDLFYGALIGFLSGGAMSMGSTAINSVRQTKKGESLTSRGNAEATVKTARAVVREFEGSKNKDMRRMVGEIKTAISHYEAVADGKNESLKHQYLGEIFYTSAALEWTNAVEASTVQMMNAGITEADVEGLNDMLGTSFTLEEVMTPGTDANRTAGILYFANKFMAAGDEGARFAEAAIRRESRKEYSPEDTSRELDGLSEGQGREYTLGGRVYRVARSADGFTVRTVDENGGDIVETTTSADAAARVIERLSRADGSLSYRDILDAEGEVSRSLDGSSIPQNPEMSTPDAEKDMVSSEKGTESGETEAQRAALKASARALLRDFDVLDRGTRDRILVMMASAKNAKDVSHETIVSAANLMVCREGLQIVFDDRITSQGFCMSISEGTLKRLVTPWVDIVSEARSTSSNEEADAALSDYALDVLRSGISRMVIVSSKEDGIGFTLWHETAHLDEGSRHYEALATLARELYDPKHQERIRERTEQYRAFFASRGMNEEEIAERIEQELNADALAEVLSTAYGRRAFAIEQRGTFHWWRQRILGLVDRIKARGDASLLRQAQKISRLFEKSMREAETTDVTAKRADGGETKRSIVALSDGKIYVEASRKIITGKTKAEQRKDITRFFNMLLNSRPSLDIHTIEGDVLTITRAETAEKARDDHQTVGNQRVMMTDDEFAVKARIAAHIDEISEVSEKKKGGQADTKNHPFAKDGFTYRRAYFKDFDGKYYEVTLSIGHNGTVATVYNVGKIKESVSPAAKIIAAGESLLHGETLSDISISQNPKKSIGSGKKVDSDTSRSLSAMDVDYLSAVDREDAVFVDEAPATTNTDVDVDTSFALLTDEDLAEYMATGKTLHTRHKKQRMLENGKKPILTSESEIREFISNAIHGKVGGEVRAFARVPKRLAEAISDVRSTLDLEGNYLEFQADALREAYKVHSSPKMQGDIALSESDFENLHRHIFDFDGVLSVNDYNGKTEVHIYRRAENGYYQIITVSSSERKSLQITKLIGVSKEKFEEKYAKKIERNTGSPRMPEASNPSTKARHTAGALSNGSSPADVLSVVTDESAATSTISITENAENSNTSGKNSSKNSASDDIRYSLPAMEARERAVEEFGYTPYFSDAGYLLPDGRMLNFSGKKDAHFGKRGQDHRAIGTIYADTKGSRAIYRFMADGNIRITAETPGIELSTGALPSTSQYNTLARFISQSKKRGHFSVDFTAADGSYVDSLYYEDDIDTEEILDDIRRFYETGKATRERDVAYSLPSADSDGNTLTASQREFFAESKVLDGEGRLRVMYQGAAEEFYTFDRKKSKPSNLYGRGFYFTDSQSHGGQYGKIRAYYLNITHPLSTREQTITRAQMRKFLAAVADNEDYSIENYGTYDIEDILRTIYSGKSDFAMLNDISVTAIGDLVEAVELFNEINGTRFDGFVLDTETVTFRSEQAKLISNTSPTADSDIRYSLDGRGNGYDGYSMSNNAREAYANGEMPLSKWTKAALLAAIEAHSPETAELLRTVRLDLLKSKLLYRSSWHHTSSMYNATDFYSLDTALLDELTEETVKEWQGEAVPPKVASNAYRGDIRYLEWGGTRKHPKATEKELRDVNITEKGSFYIVTDDNGNELLRKKIGSNGTYVTSYERVAQQKRAAAERREAQKQNSSPSAYAFYQHLLADGYEVSTSGHYYERGRKPSRADYERGLDSFFRKGEHRLTEKGDRGFSLETFDGSRWISEAFENDEVRYSLSSDIDNGAEKGYTYTKEQYESFGWAREAGAITKRELDDLYSKIQVKSWLRAFRRSSRGEFIVEVNDDPHRTLGINNVFVFVQGNKRYFRIARVVRFAVDTETEMENIKEALYEGRACNDTYLGYLEKKGIAGQYQRTDFSTFAEYRAKRTAGRTGDREESRGADTLHRGREEHGSGHYRAAGEVGDGGEITYSLTLGTDTKAPVTVTTELADAAEAANVKARRPAYRKRYAKIIRENVAARLAAATEEIVPGAALKLNEADFAEVEAAIRYLANKYAPSRREARMREVVAHLLSHATATVRSVEDLRRSGKFKKAFAVLDAYEKNRGEIGLLRAMQDMSGTDSIEKGRRPRGSVADLRARISRDYGVAFKATSDADYLRTLTAKYDEARRLLHAAKKGLSPKTLFTDKQLAAITSAGVTEFARTNEETDFLASEISFATRRAGLEFNCLRVADNIKAYIEKAKKGKYADSPILRSGEIIGALEGVIKIATARRMDADAIRDAVRQFSFFYNPKNASLCPDEEAPYENGSYLDKGVVEAINLISAGEGALSEDELTGFLQILRRVQRLFDEYDMVELEGKRMEAVSLAAPAIHDATFSRDQNAKGGLGQLLYRLSTFTMDTEAVLLTLSGGNESGTLLRLFRNIQNAEIEKLTLIHDWTRPFDEFFKGHKKYAKAFERERVSFLGHSILISEAVYAYGMLKQEDAREGLEEGGLIFTGEKKETLTVKVPRSFKAEELYAEFDAETREFVALMEHFFNEVSTKAKREADEKNIGYTNVRGGYYCPIYRDRLGMAGEVTSVKGAMKDMSDVYTPSFNKRRVRNMRAIRVSGAMEVISRHARGLATYAALYRPLQTFDRVYNRVCPTDTTGLDAEISLKKYLGDHVWRGAGAYFTKLFSDVQGMNTPPATVIDSMIRKVRGSSVTFMLGANLSSIAKQFSAYPMAGIYLGTDSLLAGIKGFGSRTSGEEMDKWCAWARARNHDSAVVSANVLIEGDKLSKLTRTSMSGLSWADRRVICALWEACKHKISKDTGLAVTDEECLKRAAELLTKVGTATQAGFTKSEDSEWRRSDSEMLRTFVMYTSDAVKMMSRLVSSVWQARTLKARLAAVKGTAEEAEISKSYKEAHGRCLRTIASVTASTVLVVLITQLMKFLLKKDRRDKNGNKITVGRDVLEDVGSQLAGLFPIVRDVYSFFTDGYDITVSYMDGLNDMLSAVTNSVGLLTRAVSGKVVTSQEVVYGVKKAVDAAGMLTGIPTRNTTNLVTGLLSHIPSFDAWYENILYGTDAKAVKEALTSGNEALAEATVAMLLKQRVGERAGDEAATEIMRLYGLELSVLPSDASLASVTVDGERRDLTAKERRRIREVYATVAEDVTKLIGSDVYTALSDEAKAKAIKILYTARLSEAKYEVLGAEESKASLYMRLIDPATFAAAVAYISSLTGEDRQKEALAHLKALGCSAGERNLILYACGWRGKERVSQICSFYTASADVEVLTRLGVLGTAEKTK